MKIHSDAPTMGKADIKLLFRAQWPTSVLTVEKEGDERKSCVIPGVKCVCKINHLFVSLTAVQRWASVSSCS